MDNNYYQNIINQQQLLINQLLNNPQENTQFQENTQPQEKLKLNPYKELNISKKYDLKSLKKAFLKQIEIYHPDKPTGDEKIFKIKLLSYKVLEKKYKNETIYKEHDELKASFNKSNLNDNNNNLNLTKNFNSTKFNNLFDDNKTSDVFKDKGYGDWFKEDISELKLKVNENNFDSEFNKYKKEQKKSNNLIKYNELGENILYNDYDQLTKLGISDVSDYSGEVNGLQYRDLKDAYENSLLIDINSVSIEDRNINSIKSDRSTISHLSDNELSEYNNYQNKNNIDEEERINRLFEEDNKNELLFNNLKNRIL